MLSVRTELINNKSWILIRMDIQNEAEMKYFELKQTIGTLSHQTEYIYKAYQIFRESELKFDPLETYDALMKSLVCDFEEFQHKNSLQ